VSALDAMIRLSRSPSLDLLTCTKPTKEALAACAMATTGSSAMRTLASLWVASLAFTMVSNGSRMIRGPRRGL
jgi:hypothetical protein